MCLVRNLIRPIRPENITEAFFTQARLGSFQRWRNWDEESDDDDESVEEEKKFYFQADIYLSNH